MAIGRLPPTNVLCLIYYTGEREREFQIFITLIYSFKYVYLLAVDKNHQKVTTSYINKSMLTFMRELKYLDDLRLVDCPLHVTCCQIELLYLPGWNSTILLHMAANFRQSNLPPAVWYHKPIQSFSQHRLAYSWSSGWRGKFQLFWSN